MDTNRLLDSIRQIVSRELDIPLDQFNDRASLRLDYGMDSVAAVNIVFAIELELSIQIPDQRILAVDCILDLHRLLS